jgi:hypothetical protein
MVRDDLTFSLALSLYCVIIIIISIHLEKMLNFIIRGTKTTQFCSFSALLLYAAIYEAPHSTAFSIPLPFPLL